MRWLFLILLICSFQIHAITFEFGRYDVQAETATNECINAPCTLTFEKTYTTAPRVFLMDTVTDSNENDTPSSLRILSVSTTQVTFQQIIAPNRANPNLDEEPMLLIDYIVSEEGVATLDNNVQFIVSSVSTKEYQANYTPPTTAHNRGWLRVNYTDHGGANFDNGVVPGVLHQIQTTNNGANFWQTSAVRGVNRTRFDIALEMSEVSGWESRNNRNYPQQEETIAFIASHGSGELNGAKFVIGSKRTQNTLGGGSPVTDGCASYADYSESFNTIPILIANKNTRSGNNGGWLRRCRIEQDRASFQSDEDVDRDSERRHTTETVGYFLFEQLFVIEECRFFTGPAQTWDNNGTIRFLNGNNVIENAINGNELGFPTANVFNNGYTNTCNGAACIGNASEMVDMPDFLVFDVSTAPALSYSGNQNVTVPPGDYLQISISGNAEVNFEDGDYRIGNLTAGGNAKMYVDDFTRFNVQSMVVAGNALINQGEDPVKLAITAHGPNALINLGGNTQLYGLVISEKDVRLADNVIVTGGVTALDIEMDDNAKIIGDIESCEITTENQLVIIPSRGYAMTCESMPVDIEIQKQDGTVDTSFIGTLSLTPASNPSGDQCWGLRVNNTCTSDPIQVSSGRAEIFLQSKTVGNVDVTASIVGQSSLSDSAQYRFAPFGFRMRDAGDNSPARVVAGRETAVFIEAVADTGASCEVIEDYSGTKAITFSNLNYTNPSSGTESLTLGVASPNVLASGGTLAGKDVTFSNGRSSNFTVQYSDAGEISFELSDPDWVQESCVGSDCTDVEDNAWVGLEGTAYVAARPYTFALCHFEGYDDNGTRRSDITGTAGSGAGFSRSGENFTARVRPVVWVTGDDDSSIDASANAVTDIAVDESYCNRATTPNFYPSGAESATVRMSIPSDASVTPVSGAPGELKGQATKSHSTATLYSSENWYEFNAIRWTEAGSVKLQTDLQANYLDMTVNLAYRNVGRFFPDYLDYESASPTYSYPVSQSVFAYLGQPFIVDFLLKAYNAESTAAETVNYYHNEFSAMRARLGLEAKQMNGDESFDDRLAETLLADGDWDGATGMAVTLSPTLERLGHTTSTTTEDGPWDTTNSTWGLYLSSVSDPIEFDATTAVSNSNKNGATGTVSEIVPLASSPTLRYGRMRLFDAVGPSGGSVNVPLQVEYWDGSAFVLNGDDSASSFDGSETCDPLIIASDSNTSSITLSGNGSVSAGTESVTAIQSVAIREQVRMWQLITDAVPNGANNCQTVNNDQPWLLYNWRNFGDESPSAIITFGSYRGNDRVIFRGERGLIHSAN
ncbi:DUF6701 domain-containing protein [Thaumasiovibrio subtropicus]|uniref:DUF6701 domain-containing protein n=1 Tax=Thaumasiovibrio subtropicus TaxID=1891207 RepID=UPI000B3614F0|nr:DUF6701 domain-containing protein [Thaumasiovibrio subtropicus]